MDVTLSQVGRNFAELSYTNNSQARQSVPLETEAQSRAANSVNSNAQENTADNQASNDERLNEGSINIDAAVAEISEFVQSQNRQLSFSVDENSQRSIVRVTDSESGDVIRQIPSDEVLRLSERIRDLQSDVGAAVGVLFNREV